MQSKATTVEQYLAELPPDRREAISAIRDVILKNLDKDYEEGMNYGMIGYSIPHRIFPDGYHCNPKQPLPFACLASQKNYMSLHIMCVYTQGEEDSWFRQAWAKTGKKLDMGKCCIRFRKLEDVALDVIGEVIRRSPAKAFIEYYKSARDSMKSGGGRPAAKKKAATANSVKKSVAGASPTRMSKPAKKAGAAKATKKKA